MADGTILERLPPRELAGNVAAAFPGVDADAVETFIAFRKFACRIQGFFDRHWRRHGVTPAGAMILIQLFHSRGAGLRPSEIALFEQVSRATVSGVIANLERQGLARRRRDPSDRRATRVFLAARGGKLLARVMPIGLTRIAALISPLDRTERRRFRKTIARLDESLTRIEARR